MKPLKIIPHPPVPSVFRAALLTQAPPALRGGFSHNFTAHDIFLNKTITNNMLAIAFVEPEKTLIENMLLEQWHVKKKISFRKEKVS